MQRMQLRAIDPWANGGEGTFDADKFIAATGGPQPEEPSLFAKGATAFAALLASGTTPTASTPTVKVTPPPIMKAPWYKDPIKLGLAAVGALVGYKYVLPKLRK